MIHVLGAGSLGLLWSARLASAGIDCRLILRTPSALTEWQSRGSTVLFEHLGQTEPVGIGAECARSSAQPVERVIVATKAYSAAAALASIAHRLAPHCNILMLQNGMGSQQNASLAYPHLKVLYASTTDGAYTKEPGHVVWAGAGITRLGDPQGAPSPIWLQQFVDAGIALEWEPDITRILWQKLAINCAINPFTVLHDCTNGQVPELAGKRLNALTIELRELLGLQGLDISQEELSTMVHDVISRTHSNSSSMRQDVAAGRRTEIDFILGYASRQALLSGLHLPTLQSLYQELRTHLATLGLPQD
ncbi:MAG TPA: 2-dehydropantoate 2-reductase [Pseudomonas xinjiangensis]|uniref:2-dehydropantoate 2-reductase n=2 Tax=root TaxID=1 RepID=A0A7V1BMX4_9GAMM|nr:2-dehydropantoate 2-reductase [Halopseudomonas xinjiangensis]HEC46566.1 2-dehydropantoate 2-reductase [Halopseudomonas xinjiangensis]